MVRTGRRRRARRVWSEVGVSAGVLLVPLILIGGAVYGLLPAHEDGAARSSALAIESLPADFNSRSAFDAGVDEPPPAVAALVSPTANAPATNAFVTAKPAMPAATKPAAAAAAAVTAIAAAAPAKPAVSTAPIKPVAAAKADAPPAKPAAAPAKVTEPATFALASEHSERVGKEVTRVLGPVPVQVTVVVPPNAAETEGGEPVSLGAAPPSSIAALPPAPADAPPAAPAAAARSSEPPREHHAGAVHGTRSHFRHLARHNQARPEAHSEEHPTQRAADPPQHDFSLRNLFQQQGGRPKNAVRG
jgi:hypothetical protein